MDELGRDPSPAEEHGSDLLARISTEMVRAQKKYFGKGPESAKSYMLDDFLLIVMRGSQTVAEKTMVEEFGREDEVRAFRQTFENEMTSRLTGMIEELTGRRVLGYQSQFLFKPEVVIEIFFFDHPADEADIAATALGQLEDPAVGEARVDARHDDVSGPITAD